MNNPVPIGEPNTPMSVVVITAPKVGSGVWSSGLFSCFSDFRICCSVLCCPPCSFGYTSVAIDEGKGHCFVPCCISIFLDSFLGLGCVYRSTRRTALRAKYNLPVVCVSDCLAHCLCGPCALSQEMRHLKMAQPGVTGCCTGI